MSDAEGNTGEAGNGEALLLQLLTDKTCRDIRPGATLAEIQNAVEVALPATTLPFSLHLEDNTCLPVVVGVSATYSLLLKAIQKALTQHVQRPRISWKYIWRHYALACNGFRLDNIPHQCRTPLVDLLAMHSTPMALHLKFVRSDRKRRPRRHDDAQGHSQASR
ncbi:Aste57867_18520 [Aphanomyces stellatus]|uniref:Aste57867_18520 protein n=1 Tax=Aphanomyces stellatus TaxID=120398 RepID=A0A485LAM7_9STRA|nr:hypothetical protein As57867_018458 [Aphanomyces stellatus]VFT95256.1 Aste57867_18520 [Aphanomyces stellatus]